MNDEALSPTENPVHRSHSKTMDRRALLVAGLSSIAALATGVQGGLAATVTRAILPASEAIRGTWTLQIAPTGVVTLQVIFPSPNNGFDGSIFNLDNRGIVGRGWAGPPKHKSAIRLQLVSLLLAGQNVSHFAREAGAFNLLGFDGRHSTGQVVFLPNQVFADTLRSRRIGLSNRDLLELALTGATVQDVALTLASFPDADVRTIALITMSNQDVQSAVALKELVPTMTARDLRIFLPQNITPAYVFDLRQSGLQNLTATDVRTLKDAHVNGAFVRSRIVGNVIPTVSELVAAKASAESGTK